jgi:hypothetical protein
VESSTVAHLVIEYMNPITKKKKITMKYTDGQEEKVCMGAMHRPSRVIQSVRKQNLII